METVALPETVPVSVCGGSPPAPIASLNPSRGGVTNVPWGDDDEHLGS